MSKDNGCLKGFCLGIMDDTRHKDVGDYSKMDFMTRLYDSTRESPFIIKLKAF